MSKARSRSTARSGSKPRSGSTSRSGSAARKRDLYVTGIPAADRLLRTDGTALLIGMLLDQQVP
ncbi:MAG: hypothetical protein ACO3VJ_04700, partial [Ilumatobacteraceae bacterium]